MESGRNSRAERRIRNFGADAKPARKRRPQYGAKGEMGAKKGPLRERAGGQIFGTYEDDAYEDENLELDYMPDLKDSDEEDAV
jgi:hypothetical protein